MAANRLQPLQGDTVRLLSCSQVITSVHSAVKELVENALDAEATSISIRLENYGLDVIEVKDNGLGVKNTDVPMIASPHSTSKISSFHDLCTLETYGFRGEALHSLATLASLSVTTCTEHGEVARTYKFSSRGEITSNCPVAMEKGTTVMATHLFKDFPVRRRCYKNTKRCRDELKKIEEYLLAFGACHPDVRFQLRHNKLTVWQKPLAPSFEANVEAVLGTSVFQQMTPLNYQCFNPMVKLKAFVPKPGASVAGLSRTIPDRLFLLVNKRPVHIKALVQVIKQAFCTAFPSCGSKYPVAVVSISVLPQALDVNLEPNKTSVLLHDLDFISTTLQSLLQQTYGPCKVAAASKNGFSECVGGRDCEGVGCVEGAEKENSSRLQGAESHESSAELFDLSEDAIEELEGAELELEGVEPELEVAELDGAEPDGAEPELDGAEQELDGAEPDGAEPELDGAELDGAEMDGAELEGVEPELEGAELELEGLETEGVKGHSSRCLLLSDVGVGRGTEAGSERLRDAGVSLSQWSRGRSHQGQPVQMYQQDGSSAPLPTSLSAMPPSSTSMPPSYQPTSFPTSLSAMPPSLSGTSLPSAVPAPQSDMPSSSPHVQMSVPVASRIQPVQKTLFGKSHTCQTQLPKSKLIPKGPSPVIDMINSKPVKRAGPAGGERSSKKQKPDTPLGTSSSKAAPKTAAPCTADAEIRFDLTEVTRRYAMMSTSCLAPAKGVEDGVIGVAGEGVWLVVEGSAVACLNVARANTRSLDSTSAKTDIQALLDRVVISTDKNQFLYHFHEL